MLLPASVPRPNRVLHALCTSTPSTLSRLGRRAEASSMRCRPAMTVTSTPSLCRSVARSVSIWLVAE